MHSSSTTSFTAPLTSSTSEVTVIFKNFPSKSMIRNSFQVLGFEFVRQSTLCYSETRVNELDLNGSRFSEQSEKTWTDTEWDISGSALSHRKLQSVSVAFSDCQNTFQRFYNNTPYNILRSVCGKNVFPSQQELCDLENDFLDYVVVVGTGIWLIQRWSLSWWRQIWMSEMPMLEMWVWLMDWLSMVQWQVFSGWSEWWDFDFEFEIFTMWLIFVFIKRMYSKREEKKYWFTV